MKCLEVSPAEFATRYTINSFISFLKQCVHPILLYDCEICASENMDLV